MNKLLFVAFAALLCYSGSEALHCNFCIGPLNSDCARGQSSGMAKQDCEAFSKTALFSSVLAKPVNMADASKDLEIVTTCVTLSLKDNISTSSVVERGCGYIYEEVDICEYLKEMIDFVDECISCDSDFCN